MRRLALLVLVAGCADKSGALLDVNGNGAIVFDRVEFYFGKEIGGPLPTSPKHPDPSAEPAFVAKRQFVDADVYAVTGGPVGALSYYVPDRPENEALGSYVAVLAFNGDQLVGIGELFDFEVTTGGAVYRYPLQLVDAHNEDIERWGRPTEDCLRWTHDRGGGPHTVGIVRANDTDCDTFSENDDPNADCLPRVYCDGANKETCEAQVMCVTPSSTDACRVGAFGCSNLVGSSTSCAADICIDEIACRDCGSGDASTCVVMNNSIHIDTNITVHPDYTLCADPFDVDVQLPTGVECQNPAILYVEDYMPGDAFSYKIAAASAGTCRVTIKPNTSGARFTAVPHMLIAIDTPTTGVAPRTAFVLGLVGSATNPCRNPDVITPQLSFGSCFR